MCVEIAEMRAIFLSTNVETCMPDLCILDGVEMHHEHAPLALIATC
jgi:hypothetical protein